MEMIRIDVQVAVVAAAFLAVDDGKSTKTTETAIELSTRFSRVKLPEHFK